MKLYNTLTRKVESFEPLDAPHVRIYSCGPTVYDHIHIGNLSAFVAADTLRRVLAESGYAVRHAMNFTDVDDKTISRSRQRYPDDSPEAALKKLTGEYEQIFLHDMRAIGNDTAALEFVRATESIEDMRELIGRLYREGYAYVADDGVYFSIEKYESNGKTYGQLQTVNTGNTGAARINNDEYDKDSVHDFALWKTRKPGEPAWEFELDGHQLNGRPGWHIECSVMSARMLGQPFDIHTGGVDLIFPHHENEIAQSTAGLKGAVYAKYFVHNEHLLVGGRKMSKSLNNFYTLRDIQEKHHDPLAFRLVTLQSHYRSQTNFSWDSLEAAQNRLGAYRAIADLRFQRAYNQENGVTPKKLTEITTQITAALQDDLNTPQALALLSGAESQLADRLLSEDGLGRFGDFLEFIDRVFGLGLTTSLDITDKQKQLIAERETARNAQDWSKADNLRGQLSGQGIAVRDTPHGPVWSRV
jgi:cysteinyl-tRNA synthetase